MLWHLTTQNMVERPGNFSVSWGLIKHADSLAPPRPMESKTDQDHSGDSHTLPCLRSPSQWYAHQEATRGGRWHLWKVCSYSPNMSYRSIIPGGTFVILGASVSWSGLCNFTWITKKDCSLWTCELARSWLCDYFKLSGHTMMKPSMGTLCSGRLGEALPLGSDSLAVTEAPLASHFHRAWFMGRWGGCRLILYGPIKL